MTTKTERNAMTRRQIKYAASAVGLMLGLGTGAAHAAVNAPINVVVPPLAFEDTHITVSWQKPSTATGISGYNIYVNGTKKGSVSTITWASGLTNNQLYYDVTGLTAGTSYSIKVRSYDSSGAESGDSNTVTQATTATPSVIYVHSYASQSGVQTTQVQTAINACPTNGKVVISSGETFTSGALYLKANCTYQIDGTLQGSDTASDYAYGNNRFPQYGTGGSWGTVAYPTNYKSLINTCATTSNTCTGVNNIRITGAGAIKGSISSPSSDSENSGYYLTKLAINERSAQGDTDNARGDLVSITGSSGVYISKVKFSLPPMHMLFIARSSNVTLANINADSFPSGSSNGIHNGDGVDLANVTTAYVFGSTFNTGDDCINMNAGTNAPGVYANAPISQVHVFNNYTLNGHGAVVFGSFTAAWMKNVWVDENMFNGTQVGLRFKTGTNRGGGADGVWATDNKMNNVTKTGIEVTGSYPDSTGMASGGVGYFKNITITNLTGSIKSGAYAINMAGNSSPKHTGFTLKNVNITGSGGKGISIYQTTASTFTNVTAASGSFVFESASLSSSAFVSCSPTPTAK
jgi:exo-poly-alpha-galacturonosidase